MNKRFLLAALILALLVAIPVAEALNFAKGRQPANIRASMCAADHITYLDRAGTGTYNVWYCLAIDDKTFRVLGKEVTIYHQVPNRQGPPFGNTYKWMHKGIGDTYSVNLNGNVPGPTFTILNILNEQSLDFYQSEVDKYIAALKAGKSEQEAQKELTMKCDKRGCVWVGSLETLFIRIT